MKRSDLEPGVEYALAPWSYRAANQGPGYHGNVRAKFLGLRDVEDGTESVYRDGGFVRVPKIVPKLVFAYANPEDHGKPERLLDNARLVVSTWAEHEAEAEFRKQSEQRAAEREAALAARVDRFVARFVALGFLAARDYQRTRVEVVLRAQRGTVDVAHFEEAALDRLLSLAEGPTGETIDAVLDACSYYLAVSANNFGAGWGDDDDSREGEHRRALVERFVNERIGGAR